MRGTGHRKASTPPAATIGDRLKAVSRSLYVGKVPWHQTAPQEVIGLVNEAIRLGVGVDRTVGSWAGVAKILKADFGYEISLSSLRDYARAQREQNQARRPAG